MKCPKCNGYKNPLPTVDVIIRHKDGIVLVERKNPPLGLALPGGFVDYGETLKQAALREAYEETGLHVESIGFIRLYDDPSRDERYHTISAVFCGTASGVPKAGDDAKCIIIAPTFNIPKLVFDHNQIINYYFGVRKR